MIKIFKNVPPKKIHIPMEKYQNITFSRKYSLELINSFFKRFPEERQGRKKFKDKEIQNTKLVLYEEVLKKANKINAKCIGQIRESVKDKIVSITISFYQ